MILSCIRGVFRLSAKRMNLGDNDRLSLAHYIASFQINKQTKRHGILILKILHYFNGREIWYSVIRHETIMLIQFAGIFTAVDCFLCSKIDKQSYHVPNSYCFSWLCVAADAQFLCNF